MWFIRHAERFKTEIAGIEILQARAPWLTAINNRMRKGLRFGVEFDLVVNGEALPFTLEYPTFFPETPPSVIPRDERRHSSHQYGAGGELCLEFRSDNWDPSVTGAMMIESAYRLLAGEQPALDERAVVPSVHQASLGQQLRGSGCRFLFTLGLRDHAAALAEGTSHPCRIVEIAGPNKTWTTYVAAVGADEEPSWSETTIPLGNDKGEAAMLIRVSSLAQTVITDQDSLDKLTATAAPVDTLPANDNLLSRMTVVADHADARLYFSYKHEGAWRVIPYHTINLTDEAATRLPAAYAALAGKKIGLIGAGSLGSKIATSLARSGVGAFVVVDDDILKPGNLIRHDLDVGSLGAHKVDGLEARLRAVAPAVRVSVRRIVLGGQESSGTTASVLDELASCDLLIDASADPQAFNFVASVARNIVRPMVWAEVYAGGIGGFVGRVRPGIEPPPHAARRQYLAWCREQDVPWQGDGGHYDLNRGDGPPLVADDADVAVIAAHTARVAIDVLVRPEGSAFPHSAYVIGLATGWIFSAPFETHPFDFSPEGEWRQDTPEAQADAAIEYVVSLLEQSVDADRTGT